MRKTNKLTKLLALVLSLVMMCSMSVSAFAAEVANVEYAQDGADCEIITIDLDDILSNAEEVNPYSRATYSLPKSSFTRINVGTLSAGQSVVINVSWTPTNLPLEVGLVKSTDSTVTLLSLTGGAARITATAKVAGSYYIMLANPSTTTALNINMTYTK